MPSYKAVVMFSPASSLAVLSTARFVEEPRRLPEINSTGSASPISVSGYERSRRPAAGPRRRS